jgi:hypothetical protein
MLMARPHSVTHPCLPGHSVHHELEMEGAHHAKCYCIFVIKLHITSKAFGLVLEIVGWMSTSDLPLPPPKTLILLQDGNK